MSSRVSRRPASVAGGAAVAVRVYAPPLRRMLSGLVVLFVEQAGSLDVESSPSTNHSLLKKLWSAPWSIAWMRGYGSAGWMYWLRS